MAISASSVAGDGATCKVMGVFPGVEAGVPGTVDEGVVGTRVSCKGAVTVGAEGRAVVEAAVVVVVAVVVADVDLSGLEDVPVMPARLRLRLFKR